jgi:hypothetical protein
LVNKGDLGFFQSRKKEDVLMNWFGAFLR